MFKSNNSKSIQLKAFTPKKGGKPDQTRFLYVVLMVHCIFIFSFGFMHQPSVVVVYYYYVLQNISI